MGTADLGIQQDIQQVDSGSQQAYTDRPFGFVPVANGKPDVSLMQASDNQATTASGSAEAARALQLFTQGFDLAAIVLEMRNIKTNEGRRYQQALAEIQQLIREALAGVAC